jgi:hypothetical protein
MFLSLFSCSLIINFHYSSFHCIYLNTSPPYSFESVCAFSLVFFFDTLAPAKCVPSTWAMLCIIDFCYFTIVYFYLENLNRVIALYAVKSSRRCLMTFGRLVWSLHHNASKTSENLQKVDGALFEILWFPPTVSSSR